MSKLNTLSRKYMGLAVLLSALLGVVGPAAAETARPLVLPCLALLVFYPALKVNRGDIQHVLATEKLLLLIVFLVTYAVIPLAVWFLARALGLEGLLLASVSLTAAAPPLLAAPYFAGLLRGNVVLAFAASMTVTLAALLVLPALAHLLLGPITGFDTLQLLRTIVLTVLLPVLVAYLLRRWSPSIAAQLQQTENTLSLASLMLVNFVLVGANADKLLHTAVGFPLGVVALFMDAGVFLVTLLVARRFTDSGRATSLAILFGLKNVALVGGLLISVDLALGMPAAAISVVHVISFIAIGTWSSSMWGRDR